MKGSENMKVFIDNLRQPPLGYEKYVFRNYIDSVTIDYDLGTAERGYDILVFMNENNIKPRHISAY